MTAATTALRNGIVAALVAGSVAGLVSRDGKTAATTALLSGGAACLGTYFLAEATDIDAEPPGESVDLEV